MNKLSKITVRLAVVIGIFAITLLTACTLGTPSTVCHATGDTANPYEKITVNSTELNEHRGHPNDIIPAPVGGCPASPDAAGNEETITICHATGSDTNPYEEITVSVNGLNGHDKHNDDIIPVPEGGCPTTKP